MSESRVVTDPAELQAAVSDGVQTIEVVVPEGVQMTLTAIALSIKPGGALDEVHVGGAIRTSGDDVVTVELADRVGSWDVAGGIIATGRGSDGVRHTGDVPVPTDVAITTEHGAEVSPAP